MSYKINHQVTYPQVRLISEDGKQIGVLSSQEAFNYCVEQGLDLVLIGENAVPPVAKAIDYKKFLYQEEKKHREARKGQKASGMKEIRLGSPFVAEGDLETKTRQTAELLKEGYMVKVAVKFVGRQITHPEFGHRVIEKIKEKLKGTGAINREPKFEGKFLVAIFSPDK